MDRGMPVGRQAHGDTVEQALKGLALRRGQAVEQRCHCFCTAARTASATREPASVSTRQRFAPGGAGPSSGSRQLTQGPVVL
jgi:hypothetical protein